MNYMKINIRLLAISLLGLILINVFPVSKIQNAMINATTELMTVASAAPKTPMPNPLIGSPKNVMKGMVSNIKIGSILSYSSPAHTSILLTSFALIIIYSSSFELSNLIYFLNINAFFKSLCSFKLNYAYK